ncbi:putative wall-associated receptor kinase-like 16 [Magnolia sinica]|uniref:putative wall-associated receptor kinase-like 16 n=1 Tax=Magnolia sinica TaxID=86752 RepID=UPI00265A0868|nr:putative wall-associated receptor kinase-like 16 [Magnolia sinica]
MALYLLLQLFWLATTVASQPPVTTKPSCPDKCGNVHIPYPFGIGDGCNIGLGGFNFSCNDTFHPPKPFKGRLEVLDISLLSGLMRVSSRIMWKCYEGTGEWNSNAPVGMQLAKGNSFTYSETHNKFTAIGCDTYGYIKGLSGRNFTSGCISFCSDTNSVINGSCSGIGCCQTDIPKGFKYFKLALGSISEHMDVWSFNPCSFAFLADQNNFSFQPSDLNGHKFWDRSKTVPVVLDWAIGNESCEKAQYSPNFACVSENSHCYNSTNGLGYRCNCTEGYQGNPYLPGGCLDINECEEDQVEKLCEHDCINLPGNYSCSCREGYHGLNLDQRQCIKDANEFPVVAVVLGIGLGLLFLLFGIRWSHRMWRERKLVKLKEKFFQQNGGLLLQEKMSCHQTFAETFKIFSLDELKKATDNYHESRIIGQGGQGTVYKGILPDQRIVAIKKSKIVDKTQIKLFINEVHILFQINHRNVVKLLGCCLEAEVPLLVYEFISNKTLSHHIHDKSHGSSISWENRLRIAAEAAGALYYLHSSTMTPIFHRDVKSANILLDDSLTAKVSDFGTSIFAQLDQSQLAMLVPCTRGYLDPECLVTGQLTEKSDVYSFGVVLMELLTGKKPDSSTPSKEIRTPLMYFLLSMKENRLFEVLEEQVRNEGEHEQLMAVAQLARRCLKLKGEDRPTMKEVVMELESLRGSYEHPWNPKNYEETEILLAEPMEGNASNATNEYSTDSHFVTAMEMATFQLR